MADSKGIKKKEELTKDVWQRIKLILDKRHISQVELQRLCEKRGYLISQPEISKLYNGRLQLTLYQLTAFSEALDLPVSYFIDEKEKFRRVHLSGKAFLVDPAEDVFKGYLGTYFTIFHSTALEEDQKVLHGTLTFSASEKGHFCQADFQVDTGEKTVKGQRIFKKYEGQLIISSLGTAYCILINDALGELNMLEFRHRAFLVKQAECRMGLVLSSSAGEMKNPVVYKIFMSRSPITEEMKDRMVPFLKLETDGMFLRKADLEESWNNKHGIEYDLSELLREHGAEGYVWLDGTAIRKGNKRMSRGQYAEILSILKQISTDSFVTTLTAEDDMLAYTALQSSISIP